MFGTLLDHTAPIVLFASLLFIPLPSSASVTISEVAWMGSAESANDEWIELYNDSDASVSVDSWILRDNMNLEIVLQGTMGAHEYAVLERTDDGSAEGSAFMFYTGALPNTGATLFLYAGGALLEDQVAGGENWESIGGDNTTKETAQYTPSGWVTAAATPGEAHSGVVHEEEERDEGDGVVKTVEEEERSDDKGETIELKVPDVSLGLQLDAPAIAYVHQPVSFAVEPAGLGKTIMDSLDYEWNFGDLSTQSGKEPTHVFENAGEYVVTVHASYGRHEQIARKTITVLPVAFSLSKTNAGDIRIHNNAKYEVDISGYSLKGTSRFDLPKRSIILPNATIIVPREKVNSMGNAGAALLDQEGTVVAVTSLNLVKERIPAAPSIRREEKKEEIMASHTAAPSNFLFKDDVQESRETTEDPGAIVQEPELNVALAAESEFAQMSIPADMPAALPRGVLPLLALCGILGLGIVGILIGRKA